MRPIILGIDPGTTSAFAAISLDFKVIKIRSKKEYSFAGLLSDVYEVGNPIIIGTDKKEVPSFVKEFSQKTGAKIYCPSYDTKKDEKRVVVRDNGFLDLVSNAHETDALASAIFAFNHYRQLIGKIDAFIEKNHKESLREKLFIKVITEDKSIASSIEEIEKKPKKKIIEVQRIKEILSKNEPTREEKELQLLLRHIRKLRYELKKAKDENAAMQRKKIDINAETKKIISFKEQRALELERIVNLQKKELDKNKKIIKKLDLFISHISAGSVIIKRLKNLGSEEFESRSEILNITEGDILLVEDMGIVSKKVIDELAGKARIIIYSGNTSKELDSRFLLIPKASLDLHETKYFASVNKECLEEEISKHANAKKVGKDFLKRLIEEYKRERNA